VACPFDVSYSCFETALFQPQPGGRLIYDESIGYDNICRFDTVEEVLEEVLRLGNVSTSSPIQRVLAFLQNNMSSGIFTLPDVLSPGDFCFRVVFTDAPYGLSVSCPPDVSYPCFETALISPKTGNILSNSESSTIGYKDICRFDTVEEVLAEILRLGN
jgi:hypothetical protein